MIHLFYFAMKIRLGQDKLLVLKHSVVLSVCRLLEAFPCSQERLILVHFLVDELLKNAPLGRIQKVATDRGRDRRGSEAEKGASGIIGSSY